jgi:tellurite resistance protein TehA-like permease
MGFVVALPALAALWVLMSRKLKKLKSKKGFPVLIMAVALAAGVGLCFTFVGSGIAAGVALLVKLASSFTSADLSWAGPLAITLLFLGWAIGDIASDRKADKGAVFSALILPTLLVLVVGGSLGAVGGNAVQETFTQLQALVAHLGHGGA